MIRLKGKDRGLIVASNRLPFRRKKARKNGFIWEKSAGGLITAMEPILTDVKGTWLGWDGHTASIPGDEAPELIDVKEIASAENSGNKDGRSYYIGCVPLDSREYDEYYNRLSNGALWGLFHYFFEKSYIDQSCWKTYLKVNERFASYIDKTAAEEDIIWIHDFHLFMTPYFLRRMRPDQEIHFFLHTPFPHIDIFSILPWQDQILESLLSCDTVGFHHRQYLENFKGAVKTYLKEERKAGGNTNISDLNSRFYYNPISIDFKLLDITSRKPEVIQRKNEIIKQTGCPKLILGVDRIDYSKGIKERLLGLEMLLDKRPELKESFFYYQLVIPSRELVGSYKILKKQIDEIIGRLNGKFAAGLWAPVYYRYGTVPFEELVALYSAADIALVTPLRDGMNLVCKEYVASRSDGDGVLILSKFTGAIAEIKNCLAVNPYSIEGVSDAIYEALTMPEKERRKRMKRMRTNIEKNNILNWLHKCVEHFEKSDR